MDPNQSQIEPEQRNRQEKIDSRNILIIIVVICSICYIFGQVQEYIRMSQYSREELKLCDNFASFYIIENSQKGKYEACLLILNHKKNFDKYFGDSKKKSKTIDDKSKSK